jgi:diguanylate cyclase (GGDEF)-like protein
MRSTGNSDSGPRFLPVGRHFSRRGRDLERFVNLWRLGIVAALALDMVVSRLTGSPAGPEATVIEGVLGLLLVYGLALQFHLGWRRWYARLPLLVVLVDLIAITGLLLGCILVHRSIVATNSEIPLLYYLFILISTGLRGDRQLSRLVAWALPLSYVFTVFLAVAWREVQLATIPDPMYGSFHWGVQVARVIALFVFVGMATYDTGLVASDWEAARTDPLTGVYNRRFLEEFLSREIVRSRRGHQPLSILLLDLDEFKAFNDVHGHLAGDQTLATVGAGLRSAVRATDVVARYGGDEFVVVLPNTPGERARRIARDLGQAVPKPLTFSAGIGCLGEDILTVADLLAVADAALLRAKRGAGSKLHNMSDRQAGEAG